MSSQRHLGTTCIDLRDEFSFDPKTTTKPQYEITYRLAAILNRNTVGAPVRFNHEPGKPIGKVLKSWIDGNTMYTEFEIWDELYNETIARGDNRELSLSHIPDWENLENSRVTELSICPKAMRPGCKIIAYHRGKPGEVEVEGNEWILLDDPKELITTEDDLQSTTTTTTTASIPPIAIEASSSLSPSTMTDMETTTTTSSLPVTTPDEGSSPEEEVKTSSLPPVNPGESEEAYWARVMKDTDYQTLGPQEKEDLHRVLTESQRNKDELIRNRQKIVDMKATFADQMMPFLKSASNKENRNDPSPLQPYIAASTTLEPTSTPAAPIPTMSEEERILNRKIELQQLEIQNKKLELSRQRMMKQANQPHTPQPQPPALAKYNQQRKQQQAPPPVAQNKNKRRYEDEMDLLQEVADEQIDQQDQEYYEEEYKEGDDPMQNEDDGGEEQDQDGQTDAYQEYAQQPPPPAPRQQQRKPPLHPTQRKPQLSVYEQNKQRLNQRQPPAARNAPQQSAPKQRRPPGLEKVQGMATGFDPATLRRPGTIPQGSLPHRQYLEIQASEVLDTIPPHHIREVIARHGNPAQQILFGNIVKMYPYAKANPNICKLYCDENNASPWEKKIDGMAQDMKYCDPSKNQTTLNWANEAGIGKFFEGRLGYTGR
jgi:hypothetical protein